MRGVVTINLSDKVNVLMNMQYASLDRWRMKDRGHNTYSPLTSWRLLCIRVRIRRLELVGRNVKIYAEMTNYLYVSSAALGL